MEPIRQAVERAKGVRAADSQQPQSLPPNNLQVAQPRAELTLSEARLESKRIVSYDVADPRSKSFDILRTQVLQSMDMKTLQLLGITSPTAGCGKTTIAINLALSIARQQERSVLLVDMDLRKPRVASALGLKCDHGLLSVLAGKTSLSESLIQVGVRNEKLFILPCESSTMSSSEWMASRSMSAVLHEIKRDYRAWIVILDLPPILPSDDVISILPQIDGVLFVAAAGVSTVSEIKECNKYLESAAVVRVVLNKATDYTASYYYAHSHYAGNRASKFGRKRGGTPSRAGERVSSPFKYVTRIIDRIARY